MNAQTSQSASAVTYSGTGDAILKLMADSDNATEGDNPYVYLSQDGDTVKGWLGFVGNAGAAPQHGLDYTDTLSDGFLLGTATNQSLQLGTNSAVRVTILNSGNIGVGTNDPSAKLHVVGDLLLENISNGTGARALKGVKARGAGGAETPPLLNDSLFTIQGGGYVTAGTYTSTRALIGFTASENWTSTAQGTYITFETTPNGSTTRQRVMTVDQSGMVSIGTNTPTHPLTVNGAIRAKEIIVDTGWSDYVFESGYRLAPLSEVEQHIKEKGHLPDVPSAKEVAAKGVSVGESQALLLRKIEELTLHLIAQEKTMAAQQAEMANLRVEVSRLSTSQAPR